MGSKVDYVSEEISATIADSGVAECLNADAGDAGDAGDDILRTSRFHRTRCGRLLQKSVTDHSADPVYLYFRTQTRSIPTKHDRDSIGSLNTRVGSDENIRMHTAPTQQTYADA